MRISERVKALESSVPTSTGITIIRRMVAPEMIGAEVYHLSDRAGGQWLRQLGETEAAFIDRATAETAANSYGIKSLIGTAKGRDHVVH